MTTSLTFQNTNLSVINKHNQVWLSASDIGRALDYKNPIQGITLLFNRYQEEFTPNMTALIDMRTNGGMQKVRIFSLRGCHLIGMLSHTKVAKDFRKWVLDILDQEIERQQQPQQLALPERKPEPTTTLTLKDSERYTLAWLWFEQGKMLELVAQLQGALDAIQSAYAPTARSQTLEYKRQQQDARPIIARMLADVQYDRANRHGLNRILQALNVPPRYGNGNYIA